MKTRVLPAGEAAIHEASRLLKAGEVIGFPTETVYGLGANALDEDAVARIFEAKGRPADNPLIVHIHSLRQLKELLENSVPEFVRQLAEAFWPGPLTMVFKKAEAVPHIVTAGLDSVGIRMPSHDVARRLLKTCGLPIAAPSANLSGRPSPTTAIHVQEDMDGRIPLILDGGACEVGLESTVLDVTRFPPKILRPGAITSEMIGEVVGEVEIDGHVLSPLPENAQPSSPGLKYRHYAPNGELTLVQGKGKDVAATITWLYDEAEAEGKTCFILAPEKHERLYGGRSFYSLGQDPTQAAHTLFAALRQMDAFGADVILAESFSSEGIGLALMNRLCRAAGFRMIET